MTSLPPIVDPHVHFWDLDANSYPWLTPPLGNIFIGDYAALRRNFGPEDLRRGAEGLDLRKVVHVDGGMDRTNPLAETQWLAALASRDPGGMPQAIVAYMDLSAAGAANVVSALVATTPRLRGVRQILNRHKDPRFNYVATDYLDDPNWRNGFAALARNGLSFDLQLYPAQMAAAAAFARQHPATQFVLNHAGMPADRDAEGLAIWKRGMMELAACPNVAAKISGLGMVDHRWTIDSIRPFVRGTLDAFGVERCMFASNFPVDSLYSDYATLWRAYGEIVADLSDAAKAVLFAANAERFYRI